MDSIVNELKNVANKLNEKELNIAKSQFTNEVLVALESQSVRLEEASKSLRMFGDNSID